MQWRKTLSNKKGGKITIEKRVTSGKKLTLIFIILFVFPLFPSFFFLFFFRTTRNVSMKTMIRKIFNHDIHFTAGLLNGTKVRLTTLRLFFRPFGTQSFWRTKKEWLKQWKMTLRSCCGRNRINTANTRKNEIRTICSMLPRILSDSDRSSIECIAILHQIWGKDKKGLWENNNTARRMTITTPTSFHPSGKNVIL